MGSGRIQRILAAALAALLLAGVAAPGLAGAQGVYIVQPGDTLAGIAAGNGTSVAALVAANGIANPNLVYSGQRLALPGEGTSTPRVQQVALPAAGPGSILAHERIVEYYGNPYSAEMGILGQLSKAELVSALQRRAAQYAAVTGGTVQPAIHMVVTVAQAGAGSDGLYRARMPLGVVEDYANLAGANGMLFFIDIQLGRSTVQAELAPWLDLLKRPYVHLAIDPEFDMWGSEVPGVDFGHMTAAEVNYVQGVLSGLVSQYSLPNKIFEIYQFTPGMLPDKGNIARNANVDLVVNMDGFGSQWLKIQHYNWYVRDTPVEYAGIKLFFDQDPDLMTPAQVLSLDPKPDIIMYQ